ncbi:transglycosylase domain-containing protein [Paraburkholderia sp. MMS20-SJTR3]|uniref:Transglycosylase domain-containing protein n=1 Tax=Paraburkholderia sejongensis TaxID=2886946 RepID=A0ABS8JNL5_9BURK|nr:transglycosylase domain-containing protein [Paraburkholderia sp. MMS20-SJTR3]MCC8391473.1 transglycosylase domain-containing protein [Paraburkholderia sp. MMS20-SJTR3]
MKRLFSFFLAALDKGLTAANPLFAKGWRHLRHPTRRTFAWGLAALPALFLLYVLLLIPFTPGIGDIRKAKVEQPAQILSADGKLLAEFKPSNRQWVGLDQISPTVVNALISTEDHRFYQHFGLDWRRTASAALHTFSGDRQGGSTLTQQLARNLYPDEIGRAPTLTRKLKEAITAIKIEMLYTKPEILETYLNTVPFLYNAYGIEMAARTYFDKSAADLNVLEAATLTGMLKGNAYYNPVLNPERALQRRNTVLGQLVKYGKLTPAQYDTLSRKPLRLDFERQVEPPGPAPHFTQQLRKWLVSWADRNDYNIYSDGLVVRTTLDSRLQTMANQAVKLQGNQLQGIANSAWGTHSGCSADKDLLRAFLRETPEFRAAKDGGQSDDDALRQLLTDRKLVQNVCDTKTRVQADFLAMDPRTGEIKAWVGSRDFSEDPFDHVQQARRQPGSTFKPFVYAAAFQAGAKPDDKLPDNPVEIQLAGGEIWKPSDEDEPSGREISLRDALTYSRNRITAQVMQTVGPNKVARLARAMGVRDSQLDPVPSLALGTSPVTLKEMVSAYGTIANLGGYVEPLMVTRIEDRNGNVLAQFEPAAPQRELPADTARTLVDVMRDVVSRGTGASIRTRFGVRGDIAGKTGTTQGNADGWFILIQPQLVAGAWVGFNDSRVTLRSDYWGQGAHSALPIVGDFFQRAQRARLVDSHLKFDTEQQPGWFAERSARLRDWFEQVFSRKPAQPEKQVSARATVRRAPVVTAEPAASAASAVIEVPEIAAGASVVQGDAHGLPPLLPAPGSGSGPAAGATAAAPANGNGVDGEAHGDGAAALAPTPTPDDVVPPDAGGQGGAAANNANGAN